MPTIVSKRHIFKFYFSVIFGTLFFVGLATLLLYIYSEEIQKGELKPKDKLMPIFSIACYGFAVYSLYRYFKNAPTIAISEEFINFNSETYALTDIQEIEFTGKRPFTYAIDFPMEAATILFKSGNTKYIFDDMYSNSWELKSYLNQVVIEKKEFNASNEIQPSPTSIESASYETFKGTAITSLRGISLWGLIFMFAYFALTSSKPISIGLLIIFGAFSSFWFLAHSYLMNYFQVSDKFLMIRNHNLFWMKKAFRLTDIKEVVFETQGKMPNCLRVITNDFRNKLYPAGTLRDNTWLELKKTLETYKIHVRNECIWQENRQE